MEIISYNMKFMRSDSIVIFILFLGLIIGSFLNVCIFRIPRKKSIVYPSSYCPNCRYKIKYYDLIPVLSYIFLKGRCRNCNKKISMRYLLIEIIVGISFSILYIQYGLSIIFFKYAITISFAVVVGAIDYYTMDVYFTVILCGLIFALTFLIIEKFIYNEDILTYMYGGIVAYLFIGLISILTSSMGWGDVQSFGVIGLFLGIDFTLLSLVGSFIIPSIIFSMYMIIKKKIIKGAIPFVPFISIASIVTILFNKWILIGLELL